MAKAGYCVLAKLVDPVLGIEGAPDIIEQISQLGQAKGRIQHYGIEIFEVGLQAQVMRPGEPAAGRPSSPQHGAPARRRLAPAREPGR